MRLVGREDLDKQLKSLIDSNHINRTFLFLGSHDSGKTFIGRYFASLILNDKVWRDAHPDFFYIKGNRGKYATLLEDFLNACNKKPFESKNVVVFFDDIDYVPLVSLNTLLKTLEEPPSKTTILLSAHSQESLLDTIISRSFKIQLKSRLREEKEDILFDMGIKNASYRLSISDDIKVCASKDFQELEKRVSYCFSAYDKFKKCSMEELPTEIGNFLEKFDLKFFFESIRHKDASLEYQFEITKRIQQCLTYNNKFLVLFNFIMSIR